MLGSGTVAAGDDGVAGIVTKPCVILAEDEMLIALTIQDLLEDHGYTVCAIAKTAESVLDLAARHKPDIALVDVNLARGSNGLDAVGPLSRSGIPSVVVSGHAQLRDAAAVGARGMLSKPFDTQDLLDLIAYVLGDGAAEGRARPRGLI